MSKTDLVKKLTTDVLKQVSPEETILVSGYDPVSLAPGKTSGGPQGFGGETAIALLLPFIYKFFEKFIDRLANRTADDAYDGVRKWLANSENQANQIVLDLVSKDLSQAGLNEAQVKEIVPIVITSLRNGHVLPFNKP